MSFINKLFFRVQFVLIVILAIIGCEKKQNDDAKSGLIALLSIGSFNSVISQTGTPPSALTYSAGSFTFTQNAAITTQTPTVIGTVTSCSANPTLPAGLNLNAATCVISGTPTVTQTATNHTITGITSNGNTTANMRIAVFVPVDTPTFGLATGHYNTAQNVSMTTTTSGATLYFTTDGTTPSTSSNLYSTAVHIWLLAGKVVKVMGTKEGMADSAIATLSGTFSYPPLQTGQTTVYATGDNGTNQTGVTRSYTGPTQHGTYTSDYTTTDNATGLVWKTCTQGLSGANCETGTAVNMNWTDAASGTNGCNVLNTANGGNGYAGIKTWRLPTRQELETLPDYGKSNPAINTTAFPATPFGSGSNWSSTAYAPTITHVWSVGFGFGSGNTAMKTSSPLVRCISGTSKEYSGNFTDSGDGTVKDNATGLIWQKCSRGQTNDTTCSGTATTATWANAIAYCNGLTLAGKTWRLPHVNELKTIVDTKKVTNPVIDTTAFPSTVANFYWSSTTFLNNTNLVCFVGFNDGAVLTMGKTANYYVRCVSGP